MVFYSDQSEIWIKIPSLGYAFHEILKSKHNFFWHEVFALETLLVDGYNLVFVGNHYSILFKYTKWQYRCHQLQFPKFLIQ